jgi:hypothetical protein
MISSLDVRDVRAVDDSVYLTSFGLLTDMCRFEFRQVFRVNRAPNCQWTVITNGCNSSVAIATVGEVVAIVRRRAHNCKEGALLCQPRLVAARA